MYADKATEGIQGYTVNLKVELGYEISERQEVQVFNILNGEANHQKTS
jgi:hypothetical protein